MEGTFVNMQAVAANTKFSAKNLLVFSGATGARPLVVYPKIPGNGYTCEFMVPGGGTVSGSYCTVPVACYKIGTVPAGLTVYAVN